MGLNEVRPRRPEQYTIDYTPDDAADVSMESGLDGRNNDWPRDDEDPDRRVSMESGLDGRNNLMTRTAPKRSGSWGSQ